MQFLPFLVLLAILPVLICLMWTFDRLVVIEFEQFPDIWVADGRPHTLLRPRRGMPRTIRSQLATWRCSLVWPFVPPTWSSEHAEASRCVRRLRVLFGVWVFGAVPLFALAGLVAVAFAK